MRNFFLLLISLFILVGCGNKVSTTQHSDGDGNLQNVSEQKGVSDDLLGIDALDESITKGLPTVVDFWAEWCGPCMKMKPIFEKLEKQYEGKITFKSINVDEESILPEEYGIDAIPTFIFFDKSGTEVKRIVGLVSEDEFKEVLKTIEE